MLSRITVKNFKCFKEETVFDFKKTNYKLLEQNTKGRLLKGALFVGDNASGKTTAIQPIILLLQLLFKDVDAELYLYRCLFSNDDKTVLKYEFEIDGSDIEYKFIFTSDEILEEVVRVDENVIIERVKDKVKFISEKQSVYMSVDSSILFLKKMYFSTKFEGNSILRKWFDFLKKSVWINAYTRSIVSFNGENLTFSKYFDKNGTDEVNEFLKNNRFKYSIQYNYISNKSILIKLIFFYDEVEQ